MGTKNVGGAGLAPPTLVLINHEPITTPRWVFSLMNGDSTWKRNVPNRLSKEFA